MKNPNFNPFDRLNTQQSNSERRVLNDNNQNTDFNIELTSNNEQKQPSNSKNKEFSFFGEN